MANFSRDGGDNRGGFRSGGGRGFDKRDSRPMVLHDAICSNCGNKCQVPFRPTGDKPVYCRDCFARMGGPCGTSGDRFQKKDRRNFTPSSQNIQPRVTPQSAGSDEVKKQLEGVNAKLERLISAVQALMPAQELVKTVPKKSATKKVSKKS